MVYGRRPSPLEVDGGRRRRLVTSVGVAPLLWGGWVSGLALLPRLPSDASGAVGVRAGPDVPSPAVTFSNKPDLTRSRRVEEKEDRRRERVRSTK